MQSARVSSGSPRRHFLREPKIAHGVGRCGLSWIARRAKGERGTRSNSLAALVFLAFALPVVTIGGGCNFGQSGIAPPANRIFLPAGVAADPDGGFLYVVNSNSDLRYNAGTVVAVDLSRIASIPGNPPLCSKTRFSRTEPVADNYCCTDISDSNILNCNEPQFIQSNATISIGSFGGAVQLQSWDKSNVRRLFVAVRAEPSITYADVTVASDPQGAATVSMRCQGPQSESWTQPPLAFCDDNWKVRRPGGATPGALVLPQEPHSLLLDGKLGALFVGHLTVAANNQIQGGGVSSIDICDPQNVHFAGHADAAFIPRSVSQSVASLSPGDPTNESRVVYAGARFSAAVSGLVLRSEQKDCADVPSGSPDRDLTLVAADTFYSSAFLPHGADIRGILFSKDGSRAWILHKNDADISTSPAALVAIDRRRTGWNGEPANTPIDFVQVCSGPTEMQMHDVDAGRGDRIFITCYDTGQVYVVDPLRMTVTAIIDVGAGPTSLVFSPTDATKAYIASFFNSHLSVIDFKPGSRTENHVILRMGLPHGYGQ
jgi:hypothetical protein